MTESTEQNKRRQISKVIGIDMSVPRVRQYLDKHNINAPIEAACANLSSGDPLSVETKKLVKRAVEEVHAPRKARRDALLEKNPDEKLSELGDTTDREYQRELVSKLRHRFSESASVALASALDYLIYDLAKHTMREAHSKKKAIIKIQHAMCDTFKLSSSYRLFGPLEVFQSSDLSEIEESADSQAFGFYASAICKRAKADLVKGDASFEKIRISNDIRRFFSVATVQLIARISPLVQIYMDAAGVKTVSDNVIVFVFDMLLSDMGPREHPLCKYIAEKCALA